MCIRDRFDVDPVTGWIIANGSLAAYTLETFRLVVIAEDAGTRSHSSSATLFIRVGDGTRQSLSADSQSAGLVAQLLEMSGTRVVIVIGFLLGLCVVIIAVCVSVCVYRIQRRDKLHAHTLKGIACSL